VIGVLSYGGVGEADTGGVGVLRALSWNFTRNEQGNKVLRAEGTLTPMSNPNTPAQFLDALLTADAGNWTARQQVDDYG
jgi:hypothetical protein